MKKIITLMVFCLLLLAAGRLLAQTNASGEETGYAYGTVSSVNADKLVICEYDYNKDEEVEVEYRIDPQVELKNLTSLDELVAGRNVEVDFIIAENQRLAKAISLDLNNTGKAAPEQQ
jgi:hypothetical protein